MEKPINLQSKGYGNLGQGNPKNLAKTHENERLEWVGMPKEMKQVEDAQKNEMGQGSSKQHKYKPNDSTGLLELSRRKTYSGSKRGPTSTSQIITWQEQQGDTTGVSIDPQRG